MDPIQEEQPQQLEPSPQYPTPQTGIPKRFFIFAGVGGFIIVLLLIVSLIEMRSFFQSPSSLNTIPTPTPINNSQGNSPGRHSSYVQFFHTQIGKTTDSDIQKSGSLISKTSLSNGQIKYTVKSVNPAYPDTIVTDKGTVIFESTSTQTSDEGGFPPLSTFIQQYGNPEEVVNGNGIINSPVVKSYLFPAKGVALIANSYTNNVYAVLRFPPMSLDAFKTQYSNYITPYKPGR